MESKSRLGKKTSKHPKDLRETRRSQNSQEPKDQSELGGAVSDHTRSSRSRTKEKTVPEETKTTTKHTNKKKKPQEKDRDDYDDYATDVESTVSRFEEDDDLDSDEEEEEEKSEEEKELDQEEEPNADYCTICKDQKKTLKSVRHSKGHSSSAYVSKLMKMFYKKSSNSEKIECSKCSNKQVVFEFPRSDPLNHLMKHHQKEFLGHEKEFLKQLGFFTMIRKNNKNFNSIVDKFPFNHQKFIGFLDIYYAGNKPDDIKKKDLLLGQMHLELQNLLISEGLDAKPNKATQTLIDNYKRHQKSSKSKQNTKTESNGNISERNKSRSQRNGNDLNEDEEDDDNPGFKPKQIGLGKREMTNPSQGDSRGKKVKTEQGDLDEETKLKAKIADLYMKLEEKDEEISRLKKLLSKK